MKYLFLLLPFVHTIALAQQESTVSISCYVNPELYIQASIVAQVADKAGKVSCDGKYISFRNRSKSTFYYKLNNKWIALKPQGKAIVAGAAVGSISSTTPTVFKVGVKYKRDLSGSMASKISNISKMNAQTDQITARESAAASTKTAQDSKQASASAQVSKPAAQEPSKPSPVKESNTEKSEPSVATSRDKTESVSEKKTVVARTRTQPSSKRTRSQGASSRTVSSQNRTSAPANAIGLRVDFGNGATGLGPNFKHRLKRNLSLDAAIVFFEDDLIGLGLQAEQAYPLKGAPGLNWYIGIGPQFLLADESTLIALVPVTGLEYGIQGSPLNLSVDWRPNFYLSPGANVDAGRFGLSLRLAF